MCSVSWLIDDNHYQIFFNRDEQKTRAKALPPRVQHMDGMKILMPIDPVGQGSWISTNELGVTLCLLNNYQGSMPSNVLFSRGLLLKSLSKEESIKGVCEAFERLTLSQFAPFVLLAFDLSVCRKGDPVVALTWDGIKSFIKAAEAPLFSSGVDLLQVSDYRKAAFEQIVGENRTPDSLLAFHQHHHPTHPHMSVCMHRDDAETVSFTQVIVTEEQQEMRYIDGLSCVQLTQDALQKNTTLLPSRSALALSV
ncbi:NRDE family protein [Marinomonas colpomeniae]|uniref:Transport and Golgi organization protein 2 n=1 Tax=Marinomonas colpomeniae TaxID=2774408 RepID=A0ABR8NWN2_9GAMM|nr:NRDE family protein [Marinomonas colpomeniae]MBD5769442.1 hypothetical protein [Marinomonas colpomeniae]